jgi:hypothetical protein
MNDIVADFSYFSSLTMAALLWRLAELGLFSRLPWFGIWLTIRLVQTPVLQLLRNFPDVQTQVWILSDALLLGSMVLTAVEIYFELTRVVFELGRAGPAVALFALILGTAVALTSTGGLADAASIQQGVFAFVAGGLGAALWFYGCFPLPVASHVWPHAQVFLIYVASHALGYWALAVFGREMMSGLDQFLTLGWCTCLVAWLWLFSRPLSYPSPASQSELEIANHRARRLERVLNH